MADKNERAQLGEQAEGDPMIARPTQADSNDLNAGDEGVDDSRSNLARGSRMSRKAGFKTAGGDNSNQDSAESSADDETDGKKTDSKETDPNESGARDASSMRGTRTSGDSGEFEGQGGQKDGDYENAQGTGYTNDRTGQLQDDGSLSGSDHSTGDKSAGDKSTGDNKRVGGQTAQNPRK